MSVFTEEREVPKLVVKDFSRLSLPSASSPAHNQKLAYTSRTSTKQEQPVTSSRFPSLPLTPDLVGGCRHCRQNVVGNKNLAGRYYNVLDTYVICDSPRTQTAVNTPDITSPIIQDRYINLHDQQSSMVSLTPFRQKSTDAVLKHHLVVTPENQTQMKHKKKIVVDIPYISSPAQNNGERCSPVGERKLAEMWKQDTAFTKNYHKHKPTKRTSKRDAGKTENRNNYNNKYSKNESGTVNHMHKFSKTTKNGETSPDKQRTMMLKTKKALSLAVEPPQITTSPFKYINTWLEAGGDTPNFLKSI